MTREQLEKLHKNCGLSSCGKAMKIANIEEVLRENKWPYFRCNAPHRGALRARTEAA